MQYVFEIFIWWLTIEFIGIAALPITAYMCSELPERGYAVSKIMGLLLLTYFSWMLSYSGLEYGTSVVYISLFMLAAISFGFYRKFGLTINKYLAIKIELFFTAAFLIFLIIRSYSPDNYWEIGEKFMDTAFINSILRSSSLPPTDPWFSGEPLNYYYFGYLLAADLITLTSTPLPTGFNIASAIFFALSASAALGLGFALLKKLKFGLITFAFVLILGNLVGFIQLVVILFSPEFYERFYVPESDLLTRLTTFSQWPSVNVIPGSISEVPYHVYLIGDLHPNMVSISFQLLILAIVLSVLIARKIGYVHAVGLGLIVGFFYPLNTWEYPTYSVLVLAGVFVATRNIKNFLLLSMPIVTLSYILYLPYHLGYKVVYEIGIITMNRTELVSYLMIFGTFIFIILYYLINSIPLRKDWPKWLAGFIVLTLFSYIIKFQLLLFLIPVLLLAFAGVMKESKPEKQLIYLLIIIGAVLSILGEIFYVRDSMSRLVYFRFNTIFKLYSQIWILYGIAASYAFFEISKKRAVYIACILIIMASVYPIFVTISQSKSFKISPTLDGERSIKNGHPYEYQAIEWLKGIKGTPVVLQAAGFSGTWNSYASAFTGLPTVLGWEWHEYQWRMNLDEINARKGDVEKAYTSQNYEEIKNIIDKYDVKYIYIGEVERDRYQVTDVYKQNKEAFELVFNNRDVEIYEVK